MFVVRGCQMWSRTFPEGDEARGGPLRPVESLCGLTLGGGVDEDLECAPFGSEARQPARDRQSHLRLVSHRGSP